MPFAIVAVLGYDPFNIKKLRNGEILIEVDKEAQSSKLLKTAKLNLTMDNVIPIIVSPQYSLNTKKGVIRCPDIKECSDEEIFFFFFFSFFYSPFFYIAYGALGRRGWPTPHQGLTNTFIHSMKKKHTKHNSGTTYMNDCYCYYF